jgi:hypothetical protein
MLFFLQKLIYNTILEEQQFKLHEENREIMPQTGPVTLFLSYADADVSCCQELKKHLSLAQRQGFVTTWYDRQITAGTNKAEEIEKQLEQASIIFLLISADFLVSDYCYSVEMTRALQLHQDGKAKVIPLLVRPCDWKGAPFEHLQLLPTNERPISQWTDRDEAWTHIVTEIRRALPSQSETRSTSAPPASASLLSPAHVPSPSSLEQRNRIRFLAKLYTRYEELFHYSLQGAVLIGLELHSKPDAVLNSTRLRLRQPSLPEYPLPMGTTLLEVFDKTGGELLVLGNPGAGKTTLLLTLANALSERAHNDEQALIPVIVNLSTWATIRKPLDEWLIQEIMQSYAVPRGPIAGWVQQDLILPLLDGLDEVEATVLPACIEAINTYKQQHLVPLVICCRTNEYDTQRGRLELQNAVIIQPLGEDQVDAYFEATGKSLTGLRSLLRNNAELRELVRTPLMLHVLILAYRDVPVQALPKRGTIQEQQQQILQQYVQRMLALPPVHVTSKSMVRWLSWIAQQMRTHNLTVFYLEHLQPKWLPPGRMQGIYDWLAVRFYGSLLGLLISFLIYIMLYSSISLPDMIWFGLTGGLVGGLVSRSTVVTFQFTTIVREWKQKGKKLVLSSVGCGICFGMSIGYTFYILGDRETSPYWYIFGISAGLCTFLLCSNIEADKSVPPAHTILPSHHHSWWKRSFLPGLHMNHLHLALMVGLLFGLSRGLSVALSRGLSFAPNRGLIFALSEGLIFALSRGLSFWLSFGAGIILLSLLLLAAKRNIILTEIITWSLPRLAQKLFSQAHLKMTLRLFLFASIPCGLTYGLSVGLSAGLSFALRIGLSTALIYWILLGVWSSLSQEVLDDHRRIVPNEGIKRSVRNGTLLGLIAGILCGLVALLNAIINGTLFYGLSYGLNRGLSYGPSYGLSYGLSVALMATIIGALIAWFSTGGLAGLRHLLLRLLLARASLLPWRTIRFLDKTTRRVLLYRDGGGYRFIHRLLLEYFANLNLRSKGDLVSEEER